MKKFLKVLIAMGIFVLSFTQCKTKPDCNGVVDGTAFVDDCDECVGGTTGKEPCLNDVRDGKKYKTVKIGTQVWMAENLNYTPSSGNSWCYDENVDNCEIYGRLYDWETALTVCPSGWHLPSDEEWVQLSTYLSSNVGGKMKSTGNISDGTGLWSSPNSGANNESGFTGLPSGRRFFDGIFNFIGVNGYWWSSTEYSSLSSWLRILNYDSSNLSSTFGDKDNGYTCRCIRD